ncbi:MAG TPA: ABC transporter permease [Mucilaginibacter sp.]|jgi:putative ABC transport system permease protein
MLKINLKLAIRNIFRNKLYTAINIIGLSVASAFCILVYLYVKNEQSFDSFHKDQDRLFRVEQTNIFSSFNREKPQKSFFSSLMKDEEQKNLIQTPMILAGDLKRNFPEVENAVRIKTMYHPIVRVGNQSFKENDESAAYVDEDFFKTFNFPLIYGNSANVLSGLSNVVISERLSKKYFGSINPVGKILNITSEKLLFTISGVAKDFPRTSSFRFDVLIPREADAYYAEEIKNGTNGFSDLLIIKLRKGINLVSFKKKIDAFSKIYFKSVIESMSKDNPKDKPKEFHVFFRPFADAHYNQSEGWSHYTDLKNIYQLVCLAILILLIASVNYILLTLTSAASRSQDVGVRKTIGANRKQIIFQYYTETQLLAFISVAAGYLLAVVCLPFFNSLTGADITIVQVSFSQIALSLFVLGVVLGIIAGIYPALAMSGIKPLNIMRSFSAFRLNPLLSNCLIIVQFSVCVILIISSRVVSKQMHYINDASMGFDKDQVVLLQNPYNWDDKQNAKTLKERLYHFVSAAPYLDDMTTSSFDFGGYNENGHLINGVRTPIQELNVDYNYFSFNKIPIIKGRTFSPSISSDTARLKLTSEQRIPKNSEARQNIVINETLYNMLRKPQIGEFNREMAGIIIGVCKDYHTDDLTKKIMPAYHKVNPRYTGYYWIRIKAGQNIPKAMQNIKSNWNKLTDNAAFSYVFLDEEVAKNYDAYLRWMSTITTSCFLTILIACLGLFGLSGLTTINRTKEIGIRKILGASVSNLFLILNRGTLVLAAGSFIIAIPIAYYLVHQWLDNFAYRFKPDWLLFASAGIIAMLTAVIAVSYHTIKAATANPIDSLRRE